MSPEKILFGIAVVIVVITCVFILFKKAPKRVKKSTYVEKWRTLQKLCADKKLWSEAVVQADVLLDEVMKKRRVSGKTMGERLVAAQKQFSSNDTLWDAHKLAGTIKENPETTLSESEVKRALVAFRQALRDMGALQ